MSVIALTVLYIHQDEINCAKVSAIYLTVLYIHQAEINCANVSAIFLTVLYIHQAEINWAKVSAIALTVLYMHQDDLFSLFGLVLYVPVYSYSHVGTVSSPNHTFFLGKLDLAVNQYFMNILSLVTDNNPT